MCGPLVNYPMGIPKDISRSSLEEQVNGYIKNKERLKELNAKFKIHPNEEINPYRHDLLASYYLVKILDTHKSHMCMGGNLNPLGTLRQILKSESKLFSIRNETKEPTARKEFSEVYNDIGITIHYITDLLTTVMHEMIREGKIIKTTEEIEEESFFVEGRTRPRLFVCLNYDNKEEIVEYLSLYVKVEKTKKNLLGPYSNNSVKEVLRMYDFLNSDAIPKDIKEMYYNCNTKSESDNYDDTSLSKNMKCSRELDKLYKSSQEMRKFFTKSDDNSE
jgi:hypothetical protein